MDLQRALHSPEPFSATVATCLRCADQSGAGLLQIQLRRLLHHHSGVRAFKTRQMMLDVQTLARHHAP
jgi:DNA repair protein RecO (recombination protein O)